MTLVVLVFAQVSAYSSSTSWPFSLSTAGILTCCSG